MKKWTKKKIIISVLVAMLVVYVVDAFYVPYKEIEIDYLGTMRGGRTQMFFKNPEEWTERDIEGYMYNYYTGYRTCSGEFIIERYGIYEFDFEPDIDREKQYVLSYGYPIKSLQYTKEYKTKRDKGYYSRAKMDVENYQEGVWFIYKMEDIHLGNMIYEEVDYIDGLGTGE